MNTGPKSTSFQVFVAGALPGLLTLAHGLLAGGQPASAKLASILGGSGLTGVAAAFKLLHDSGIHKATIAAAGSDVQASLPELRLNIDKVLGFAESDFPGLKTALDGIGARVSAVESKIPDATGIESLVRSVVASVLVVPPAAPTPAVTPPA